MEKLIDLFCHAIRITDPLSIKIAVGIVGGGLPLILIVVGLTKLGEFVARQREITMPSTLGVTVVPNTLGVTTVPNTLGEDPVSEQPVRRKESVSRRSRSTLKKQPVSKVP